MVEFSGIAKAGTGCEGVRSDQFQDQSEPVGGPVNRERFRLVSLLAMLQRRAMLAGSVTKEAIMAKPGTTAATAVQLVLFEHEDHKQSNLIALYDLAPRFVFSSRETDAVAQHGQAAKSIFRRFDFNEESYMLTLQPALVAYEKNGNMIGKFIPAPSPDDGRDFIEVFRYPSEREQLVEQVIRRLAMERSRLALVGDGHDRVLLQFSLHEVRRELRAVNHGLDGNEVREALTILARSRIIISKVAPGAESTKRRGTNVLESTAFPVLAVRRQDGSGDADVDDTDQTYLEFNPLVAASIRRLEFRPVSYAWLMRLRSPVSRWLYNRLSVEYDQPDAATVTPVTLSADQIIANSGMTPWSRQRDTLRVVTAAVDALVAEGILDTVEKFCTKTGKRVDGIEYTLMPSARFLDQARHAGHMQSVNTNIMRSIVGDTKLNNFIVISSKDVANTRRHRVQQLAAAKSLAAPSLSSDTDQPAP